MQGAVELAEIAFHAFEHVLEQRVLHYQQLDVGLEAGTTQFGGVLGIESGGLYKVEAVVLADGFGDLFDY